MAARRSRLKVRQCTFERLCRRTLGRRRVFSARMRTPIYRAMLVPNGACASQETHAKLAVGMLPSETSLAFAEHKFFKIDEFPRCPTRRTARSPLGHPLSNRGSNISKRSFEVVRGYPR